MRNCTYKLKQSNGTFIEFETEEELVSFLENYSKNSFTQQNVEIPNEELDNSYRPTSALITTSNQINRESGSVDKGKVVDLMNLVLENYEKEGLPYTKGKLISRFKLFNDIGIDVNKVNEYIANYWKEIGERTPTKADIDNAVNNLSDFLGTTAFIDTVEMSAVRWLFDTKVSENNESQYGKIDYKNKFNEICGRTFALAFTKEDGSLGTFSSKGLASDKGVTLAWQMPYITKTEEGYIFDSIRVQDLDGLQGQLKEMYEIQETFKNDQSKEVPVNNIIVSQGARVINKTDAVPLTEEIEINTDEESKNRGKVSTKNGQRVYTKKISPEDALNLAKIRLPKTFYSNKEAKKYFDQMVHIKKEDNQKIFDDIYKELQNGELTEAQAISKLSDILQEYHYNIPLEEQIVKVNYEQGVYKTGNTINKKDHLKKVAFTMKSDVSKVNRKLYFSLAEELPVEKPVTKAKRKKQVRNDDVLLRSNFYSNVTAQQESRAIIWFKNSFLSQGIDLNLAFTDNPKAFADFTNTAITLYRGANYTHLYHEAFHRFTQHFLSPQERTVLYAAVKSLISDKSLVSSENLKYEEALAEGFRSYMLSGGKTITLNINGKDITINTVKPLEAQKPIVSWYQKIFNFFKSLFSNKTDYFQDYYGNSTPTVQSEYKQNKIKEAENLITKYFKEASNLKQNRNNLFRENPKNTPYRTLNSNRTFTYVSNDNEEVVLTLDSTAMYELQQGIDALFVEEFKSKHSNESIALLEFQDKKTKQLIINNIYDKIFNKLSVMEETSEDEVFKKEIGIILDNWVDVVKESSGFRKEFNDLYNDEEIINSETYVLKTAENFEQKSQLELSSSIIINLLSNLPLIKNGKPVLSKKWKLPLSSDFNSNWSVLQRNLSGKKYPEMLEKIKQLSTDTYPQFRSLLQSLPNPKMLDSKVNTLNLMTLFEQTFKIPRVQTQVSYVEDREGELVIKPTEAGSKVIKQIINRWKSNAKELNIPSLLPSLKIAKQARLFNLDVKRTDDNKESIKENYEIIFDFLDTIGINFTELNLEYAKGLEWNETQFLKSVGRILNTIEKYAIYFPNGNIVEMLDRSHTVTNVENLEITINSERTPLENIADLEEKTNETLNDDMIIRADGNAEWRYRQYNYVSKFIDDINTMPYETVKSIYPALDVVKNPGIKYSPLFKTLFYYDKTSDTYEKYKNIDFEMFSNSGIEDIDQKLGFVATDISTPDKLLSDFYTFLLTGKEEFTRFGDKSSAFGVNNPVTEKKVLTMDNYEMNRQFFSLIATEVVNYQHHEHFKNHEKVKFTKGSKQKLHENLSFIMFDEILKDEQLKKDILKAEITKNDRGRISFGEDLDLKIEKSLDNYFNNLSTQFKSNILSVLPAGKTEQDLLIKDIRGNNENLQQLVYRYLKLSTANRIDHFNLMFGDLRNYKNGSDVFKRLSQFSATGLFPSLIKEALDKLQERSIEPLFNKNKRTVDDKFTFVQFNNVPVNLPKMLVESVEDEKERKALADYINLDGKDKGDRTDAQGAVTLDFYRLINNLIGNWNISQEDAYLAQVEFVKAKQSYDKTDDRYIQAYEKASKTANDLLVVWNPKKWQYAGSILSEHTIAKHFDVRAFLKFSLAPLIPTVIEGKPIEKIAENMYKSGTDLYTFSSGNKNSIDQEPQDFQDWNKKDKTEFNPSVLTLHSFKEQLPVDNKMKEDAIFASQMRALMSSGLFENGKAVRDEKDYLNYKKSISNLTELAKAEISYRFSSTDRIVEFLEKEFDKRDMPYHVKDFIKMYKNNPIYTFDTSFQSYYIMNTLFSLITRNIVKQAYPGGQFIQVSDLGYTNATFKDIAKYENTDLEFYPRQEDGSSGKAEIKIAFSKKYKPLLNIVYNNVKIGTLERLNELLKDKEFVALHGDKFTMTACRIPVQSFSTIESFIVKEFLPSEAGQIVIVPPGLTIKTGSDFDIDKLNIYEPILNNKGELISLPESSEESLTNLYNKYNEEIEKIEQELKEAKDKIKEYTKLYEEEAELWDSLLEEESKEEQEERVVDLSKFNGKFSLEELQLDFKEKNSNKEIEALKNEIKAKHAQRKSPYQNIKKLKEDLIKRLEINKKEKSALTSANINNLIKSMSNIILDKDNRENLLKPNEINELNELLVKKGLGEKGDAAIPLSQVINPLVSAKVREDNFSAKDSLGIAAKANKTFALFQEAGLNLLKPFETSLLNNNKGELSNSFTEEYKGIYPMYDTNNNVVKFENFTQGLDKRQILSQFVSGTVDVANDARIGSINFNTKTAPIYIHAILKNIHLFDIASIMTHPSVISLIKELEKRNSFYYKFFATRAKNSELLKKGKVKTKALINVTPSEFLVYKDENQLFLDNIETSKNILRNKKDTPLEAQILAEYLLLEQESKHTNALIKAVSWDTDSPKSFVEYAYYDKLLTEAKQNFLPDNINALKSKTITSSLNATNFVNEKFSPLFKFINNPSFIKNLLNLYDKTFGKDLGDFTRDYTNSLFTYIYQNNGMYYEDLIINKKVLNLDNENNLENRLKQLKAKFEKTALEDNYFLKQLDFKKSPSKSNYIYPKLISQPLNSQQGNVYHEELMKLIYPDYSLDASLNLELREWALDLIRATLSFNGTARMQGSIIDLLPQEELEDYSEIIYEAFTTTNEYEQIDYSEFHDLFKVIKGGKYFNNFQVNDRKDVIHTNNFYKRNKEVDSTPKATQSNVVISTNLSEEIYSQLGNKTQSENVILPKDLEDNTTYKGKNFWDKIVPEAKSMFDRKFPGQKPMLIAFRGNSKKSFLQNYKDQFVIGNPFNWQSESEKENRTEQGISSTKKFIEWMITGNNFGNEDATEEYRQAIINDIKSREIVKSPILYYEEKDYATHATALDYLINEYDWNTSTDVKQPISKEKPKRFIKSPETTSKIMKGSVIEYKNKDGVKNWLVWNITKENKLQLIGLDGSKFSGTPNKDSKNITKILGAYNTTVDESTGVDVIVTDNNNIYSTATGKKLYESKDGSSLKKRNDIFNSLQTDENDVSLLDLGLNEDLDQEDFKCNKNEL